MTWVTVLKHLPQIISLIEAIMFRLEMQTEENKNKKKEVDEKLEKMAKAIKENDEKTFNDVFNSF